MCGGGSFRQRGRGYCLSILTWKLYSTSILLVCFQSLQKREKCPLGNFSQISCLSFIVFCVSVCIYANIGEEKGVEGQSVR